MTVQQFYDWAVRNGVADCEVEVQYRDDGGYYYGTDCFEENDIEIDEKPYGKIVIV